MFTSDGSELQLDSEATSPVGSQAGFAFGEPPSGAVVGRNWSQTFPVVQGFWAPSQVRFVSLTPRDFDAFLIGTGGGVQRIADRPAGRGELEAAVNG